MEVQRLGAVFRAVRLRLGLRQADVALRAGVPRSVVSRLERGHVPELRVDVLLRVAAALDVRVDVRAWWRGGELDRMLAAGHAAMHEAVAKGMAGTDWLLSPETSFAIYGERGVIDILAFHPPTASLLVIELKTELVDVNELISVVDRYRRLAAQVARDRGWVARTVSCWVILRDTRSNHRRLAAYATVLRTAFPDDGRRMRAWLQQPVGAVAALSFLPEASYANARPGSPGVQRVRRRKPSVDASSIPVR